MLFIVTKFKVWITSQLNQKLRSNVKSFETIVNFLKVSSSLFYKIMYTTKEHSLQSNSDYAKKCLGAKNVRECSYIILSTSGSFCSNWYRCLFWVKFLKIDDTICNIALKAV